MLKYFSNAVSLAELQSDYKRLLQKYDISERVSITEEYSKLYECLIRGISMFDLEHEVDMIRHMREDLVCQPTDHRVLFMVRNNGDIAYMATFLDYSRRCHASFVKTRFVTPENKKYDKIKCRCGFMDCKILNREMSQFIDWTDTDRYTVDILSAVDACTIKSFMMALSVVVPVKEFSQYHVHTISINNQTVYAFSKDQIDTRYAYAFFYIDDKIVMSTFDMTDVSKNINKKNIKTQTLLDFITETRLGLCYHDLTEQLDFEFNPVATKIGFTRNDKLSVSDNPILARYMHLGVISIYRHGAHYTGRFNRNELITALMQNNITLEDIDEIDRVFVLWYNTSVKSM